MTVKHISQYTEEEKSKWEQRGKEQAEIQELERNIELYELRIKQTELKEEWRERVKMRVSLTIEEQELVRKMSMAEREDFYDKKYTEAEEKLLKSRW